MSFVLVVAAFGFLALSVPASAAPARAPVPVPAAGAGVLPDALLEPDAPLGDRPPHHGQARDGVPAQRLERVILGEPRALWHRLGAHP